MARFFDTIVDVDYWYPCIHQSNVAINTIQKP